MVLKEKSKTFALRIISMYKYLCSEKQEYVLSKQVLRSGTSIGANIYEAFYGQSKADMACKYTISLKEANETIYWLELLHESKYITDASFESINIDCVELIKMLTSTIKKLKEENNENKL